MNIKNMIAGLSASRALVLMIDRWWSTRLFLLASLLRSLTPVRQVVFSGTEGHFVGMASPTAIVDALAYAFPEIGEFARKLSSGRASLDIETETNRQIDEWNFFIKTSDQEFPQNACSSPPTPPASMGALHAQPAGQVGSADREKSIKVVVRAPLLERWLGERWIGRCIQVDGHDLSMSQVQQIVDSLLPDVPVQRQRKPSEPGMQVIVVDRDAFALQLAREWVRSGLPRSPVR